MNQWQNFVDTIVNLRTNTYYDLFLSTDNKRILQDNKLWCTELNKTVVKQSLES